MASPSFKGAGSVVTDNAPIAPECAAGDLLVLTWAGTTFNGGVDPITPPGWTLAAFDDGYTMLLRRYVKQAAATDSETAVALNGREGGPMYARSVIVCYSSGYGVDQTATNGLTAGAGGTTMTAAAVTTTRSNELVDEAWIWVEAPSGSSDHVNVSSAPSTQRVAANFLVADTLPGLLICTQPQTTPGTTPDRSATLTTVGYWLSATLSIYPNNPPNAPILAGPADTGTVNVEAAQRFSWTPSDDDPSDASSGFSLRYSDDAGATWTTISRTTPFSRWDAAAGTFTDGVDYEWQVRTKDRLGVFGPYSASFHFTGATVPDVPTITAPTSDETVGTATVDVVWSFDDQEAYQVRLVADDGSGDPDTGTVLFDSGQVDDTDTRVVTVDLDATGVTRHAQVSVKSAGLWSDFADVRFDVNFDGPSTPTVALTTNTSPPTITAYITNPDPTGDEQPVAYNDLLISDDGAETWWRAATMLPTQAQWIYYTPASGVDYQFRAVAYTDAGTFAYSTWVDEAVVDMGTPDAAPDLIPEGSP